MHFVGVAVVMLVAMTWPSSAQEPKCALKACELRGLYPGMDAEVARVAINGKSSPPKCETYRTHRHSPTVHNCKLASYAGDGISVQHHDGKVVSVVVSVQHKTTSTPSDDEMRRHLSDKYGKPSQMFWPMVWGGKANRSGDVQASNPDGLVLYYSEGQNIVLINAKTHSSAIASLKDADPNKPVSAPPPSLPKL